MVKFCALGQEERWGFPRLHQLMCTNEGPCEMVPRCLNASVWRLVSFRRRLLPALVGLPLWCSPGAQQIIKRSGWGGKAPP